MHRSTRQSVKPAMGIGASSVIKIMAEFCLNKTDPISTQNIIVSEGSMLEEREKSRRHWTGSCDRYSWRNRRDQWSSVNVDIVCSSQRTCYSWRYYIVYDHCNINLWTWHISHYTCGTYWVDRTEQESELERIIRLSDEVTRIHTSLLLRIFGPWNPLSHSFIDTNMIIAGSLWEKLDC